METEYELSDHQIYYRIVLISFPKYVGTIDSDGKPHGKGIYYFKEGGAEYHGQFQNGNFEGKGILKKGGDVYKGQFKNDKFSGKGSYTFYDGDRYEGDYKDGERHGTGTYYYARGNKYQGEFKDNQMFGEGTYYFADGDRFEGNLVDGKFVSGKYKYANGQVYIGKDHKIGRELIPNLSQKTHRFINFRAIPRQSTFW